MDQIGLSLVGGLFFVQAPPPSDMVVWVSIDTRRAMMARKTEQHHWGSARSPIICLRCGVELANEEDWSSPCDEWMMGQVVPELEEVDCG
jgi:hypothetical protein